MGEDGATPVSVTHILNTTTLMGIVILAVPVVFADARKAKAARVDENAKVAKGAGANSLANAASERANHWATRWRAVDRLCLYMGYMFLLGSAAARVWLT